MMETKNENQMEKNETPDTRYVLIETVKLEELIRRNFILSKSVLAFEYLLDKSDRPMYLTVGGVLEVLGIKETDLDECRLKRLIRVKIVKKQMLYNLYDLVMLSERLQRRRIQREIRKVSEYSIR